MIKKITPLLFVLSLFSQNGFTFDRVSVALGGAEESTDVARLGLQKDFNRSWFQTENSEVTGYWELSASYWDTDDKNGDDITAIALSPVFTYRFKGVSIDPYIEAGVGVSYISDEVIGDNDLGGHFQFEDRLGIGARFGAQRQHDLALRVMHFSNADIYSENDGINMLLVAYSYKF